MPGKWPIENSSQIKASDTEQLMEGIEERLGLIMLPSMTLLSSVRFPLQCRVSSPVVLLK